MTILVIADHDNENLSPATLSTLGAAGKIGGDIHILVAGSNCADAAQAAASVHGVSKILKADDAALAHALAENIAPLIVALAKEGGYSHILAPATTFGKNIMPRAAALLDVQQISDISGVVDADTFERPVYAGNAIATVKSSDSVKVITVRGASFDPAPAEGGSATIEDISAPANSGLSSFAGQELSKSERPDLTAARVVVSGGRGVGSAENFAIVWVARARSLIIASTLTAANAASGWA